MADKEQYNPNHALFSDISVKLRDIEEKQNIIKDRVLLIGENLVSEKDENERQIIELKSRINSLSGDIKKLRLAIERIIDDQNSFIRKNEFQILQRQFEMFQPLNLARISDVESMINKALKTKSK